MLRVLVVEDKYLDFLRAKEIIEMEFEGVVVERIKNEFRFRQWLFDPQARLPDLLILDNRLPWTERSRDPEAAPEEVHKGGPADAGLRCHKLLRAHSVRCQIPVIILTGFPIACPSGMTCVKKTDRSALGSAMHLLLDQMKTKESVDGK